MESNCCTNINLEKYFSEFREKIIGIDSTYQSPYGEQTIIYADWIASGRLYSDIEKILLESIYPYCANTHTETSETGALMTNAYHLAHKLIKQHCNAASKDVIITAGSGMTTLINKLQRMLGLKSCGQLQKKHCIQDSERPIVFITHLEHHSNHTSWFEANVDLVIVPPGKDLEVDPNNLIVELEKYKDRTFKIGSFSACSNVTGVFTPYHKLAKIMHQAGGICFVDLAASAPYVNIDMHPEDPLESLDGIMFSPHKFLGGPGTSGVLIFNSELYKNPVPDQPGGGTVDWTNPWGEYKYIDNIEVREDGGTPGFLQAIRAALAIKLKEKMTPDLILKREHELLEIAFNEMEKIEGLNILAHNIKDRLGVISFYLDSIHYNLIVKLLSDRFGIQVRGGCACAGTYGHFLLNVTYNQSKQITDMIDSGDLSAKPGWVRLSLHPTMTNEELYFIIDAIAQIKKNIAEWEKDYIYDKHCNEFRHFKLPIDNTYKVKQWFDF